MHLCDARGGQGHVLEGLVDFGQGRAQCILDALTDGQRGHGRDVVEQLLELRHHVCREHVGACGRDLSQLDEGGAEILQHVANARTDRAGDTRLAQRVVGALAATPQSESSHYFAEPVACEHLRDVPHTPQVASRMNDRNHQPDPLVLCAPERENVDYSG
jgi:hypothetical protein